MVNGRRQRGFIILRGWCPVILQMRAELRRGSRVPPTTTKVRTIYLPKMIFLQVGDFQLSRPSPRSEHKCTCLCQRRGTRKNLSFGIQSSILGFKVEEQEAKCLRGPRHICRTTPCIHEKIWMTVENACREPGATLIKETTFISFFLSFTPRHGLTAVMIWLRFLLRHVPLSTLIMLVSILMAVFVCATITKKP